MGVLWIVGQVGELHGVGVHIEEHGTVGGSGPELGIAKLFGADGCAVDGLAVFAPRC